jgi:hypothetical protein
LKKYFEILFPILLISLLSVHCTDDDDSNDPCASHGSLNDCVPPGIDTLFVGDEIKKYYFFPKGSWWVYERTDTNASIYDTVKVIETFNNTKYQERLLPYAWQNLMCRVEHSYYESFQANWEGPYGFKQLRVQYFNTSGSSDALSTHSFGYVHSSYDNFFSIPIDSISILNRSLGGGGGSFLYSTSDVEIDSTKYTNVAHIQHSASTFKDAIVLSKNIGIIKFHDSFFKHSWELVNFHINP